MSTWQVRHAGSPRAVTVPSAQRVVEGVQEGNWEETDEVRGPGETAWRVIEDHPVFADAMADLHQHEPPVEEETRLDMNPLIDVSLVLLIFFIITTTYASMRRSLELPPEPPEDGKSTSTVVKKEDIKDRSFRVKIRIENGEPVIRIEDKPILLKDLEVEIQDVVKNTGRREMYADVAADVPWGIEAKLYDAAKAADIHEIYWPKGK